MTQDQQRIAIAKACGWTEIDELRANRSMGKPPGKISFEFLPNYPADLNACHEMEQVMTTNQFDKYCHHLDQIRGMRHCTYATAAERCKASAAERCEAFRRTLGLWTPTPTQPQ
jgi:hypothetical protein